MTLEEKLALEHLVNERRRLEKEKVAQLPESPTAELTQSPTPEPPIPVVATEPEPTPQPTTISHAPPPQTLSPSPVIAASEDDSENDPTPPPLKLSYRNDDGVRTATLKPGTQLKVKIEQLPVVDDTGLGQRTFTGRLDDDVKADGHTVIYKGTPVDGRIWYENGQALFQLRTITIAGREYALDTATASQRSLKRKLLDVAKFTGIGIVAGAAVDGKDGAKKGGIAGAAVGIAYSFSVDKPVTFKLRSPARVPLGEDIRWQSR